MMSFPHALVERNRFEARAVASGNSPGVGNGGSWARGAGRSARIETGNQPVVPSRLSSDVDLRWVGDCEPDNRLTSEPCSPILFCPSILSSGLYSAECPGGLVHRRARSRSEPAQHERRFVRTRSASTAGVSSGRAPTRAWRRIG